MFDVFSELMDIVPLGKKIGEPSIECFVSKLHYRATFFLVMGCCCLVTALDWVGNGNTIECIQDEYDEPAIETDVMNTYCYIMSTFTLPRRLAGGSYGDGIKAHPGIGTYNPKTDDVTYKSYYQWVPFVLFLQACLFYAPHLLYKNWEGGKVVGIISGLNRLILDKMERRDNEKVLAQYLFENINTHNIWAIKMFLAEAIYLLNIIGNIYFMDVFLGGEFRTYGIQVAQLIEEDPENRVDPMSRIFPRVTKCTFEKFGPSGSLQRHDAFCILPINIINEKIYVFLWFWLLILLIITGLSLIYRGFLSVSPSVRSMRLKSKAANQLIATSALDQISRRLQMGDWLLLNLLGSNMEPSVFGELLHEFSELILDEEQQSRIFATCPDVPMSIHHTGNKHKSGRPNNREQSNGHVKNLLTEI